MVNWAIFYHFWHATLNISVYEGKTYVQKYIIWCFLVSRWSVQCAKIYLAQLLYMNHAKITWKLVNWAIFDHFWHATLNISVYEGKTLVQKYIIWCFLVSRRSVKCGKIYFAQLLYKNLVQQFNKMGHISLRLKCS